MKTIILNGVLKHGIERRAVVDDRDFEYLSRFTWSYDGKYAVTTRPKRVRMHVMLMRPRKGYVCDHIDGDGLNNTRANLRVCSHRQNIRNRALNRNNSSGYKGVYERRNRSGSKWYACIVTHKTIYLGTFDAPQKAAEAYNVAALRYFGKFARLNEISPFS